MPAILDFQIRPKPKDSFHLEVFAQAKAQPLAKVVFEYPVSHMTQFARNRLDLDKKDPIGRMKRLKAFGTELYEKLFTPEVERVWQACKKRSDFLILRLQISPEATDLEALPWETRFDGEEFLAASVRTGVSRLSLDISPKDAGFYCQPAGLRGGQPITG